jgi:transcriptional regulator with XRE-family HTH domain
MSQFGQSLRDYRMRCTDPQTGKTLTQERLAELLGYTPQTISLWERGRSKIHADDRHVLVNILKVLHNYEGMPSLSEANTLLSAGNYRPLNDDEQRQVFPGEPVHAAELAVPVTSHEKGQTAEAPPEGFINQFKEKLGALMSKAAEGPPPKWPRLLVALIRWPLDRLTNVRMAQALFWIWTWLITWLMITPSLHWPFFNREQAWMAIVCYAGGTLISPLLIGSLTSTSDNAFWQQHNLATTTTIRLYTYQGAFIGFHLGYMVVFAASLGGHLMGISQTPWLDPMAAALPVGFGYAGARLVPDNLWRAYGRLRLNDGAIFFIFLFLGPLWGVFFYAYYPWLLTPITAVIIWLSAITILAAGTTRRRPPPSR